MPIRLLVISGQLKLQEEGGDFMKRLTAMFFYIGLCVAVAFLYPEIGISNQMVNNLGDAPCLECHEAGTVGIEDPDTLHGLASHNVCTDCHGDTPGGPVPSVSCLACHPDLEAEVCDLVDVHENSVDYDPPTLSCLAADCHAEACGEPTTTTTIPAGECSIDVTQAQLFRSRWIPLPAMLTIKGTNTNFQRGIVGGSQVEYEFASSRQLSIINLVNLVSPSTQTIQQFVIILPSLWTGCCFDGATETVTVSVTNGGCDTATDTFELNMMPLILDEQ